MPQAFDARELIASLPNRSGVYRMLNAAGETLYVGKARDLRKRVASYFQKTEHAPRTALMVTQVARVETTVTRSEGEALLLENNLIKAHQPRYNVVFRDDKSYGYILITGHKYPQIRFYRGAHQKGNKYFGPFPSAWSIRETIGHLQKIFLLRTCDDMVFAHRSRPCLLHQIHRCSGPCVELISEEDYGRDVRHAEQFLEGNENEVIEDLTAKMHFASEAQRYELAAHHRDQIRILQRIISAQAAESTGAGDVDIIVAIERESTWCVTLAMVRAGRHLGDRSFFPSNAAGSDAPTVIEAFIAQHYAQQPVPGASSQTSSRARTTCEVIIGSVPANSASRVWLGRSPALAVIHHRLASSTNCTWVSPNGRRVAAMNRCHLSVARHRRKPGAKRDLLDWWCSGRSYCLPWANQLTERAEKYMNETKRQVWLVNRPIWRISGGGAQSPARLVSRS